MKQAAAKAERILYRDGAFCVEFGILKNSAGFDCGS
jgi:hypothetical protein